MTDYVEAFIPAVEGGSNDDVAIFHSGSAYEEEYGTLARDTLEDAGVKLIRVQGVDVDALDMLPELSLLQDSESEATFVGAYGAPLRYILDGFEKLGWDVPIYGTTSVSAIERCSRHQSNGESPHPNV